MSGKIPLSLYISCFKLLYQMSDTETFYLDEETCGELRIERDSTEKSYMEISETLEVEPEVVTYHVTGECECDHEVEPLEKDRPWTEEELLRHLLIEKNMHYTEVGEAFGCHQETVKNWAGEDRFDITVIDSSERVSSKIVRIMHRRGVERSQELEDPADRIEQLKQQRSQGQHN